MTSNSCQTRLVNARLLFRTHGCTAAKNSMPRIGAALRKAHACLPTNGTGEQILTDQLKEKVIGPGRAKLIQSALPGILVGAPAHNSGAMPKAADGDMIKRHFHDQFRPQGLPLRGSFRAPTTGAARRAARKTWRGNQVCQLLGAGFNEFQLARPAGGNKI